MEEIEEEECQYFVLPLRLEFEALSHQFRHFVPWHQIRTYGISKKVVALSWRATGGNL
jgi:hypothetical protein